MNPRTTVASRTYLHDSGCAHFSGWILLKPILGSRSNKKVDLFFPRAQRMEAAGFSGKQILSGDAELVEGLFAFKVIKTLRMRRITFRYLAINSKLRRFN